MDNIKDLLSKAVCKEEEHLLGEMALYIKANTEIIASMAEANIFLQMEKHLREIGKTALEMGTEILQTNSGKLAAINGIKVN